MQVVQTDQENLAEQRARADEMARQIAERRSHALLKAQREEADRPVIRLRDDGNQRTFGKR